MKIIEELEPQRAQRLLRLRSATSVSTATWTRTSRSARSCSRAIACTRGPAAASSPTPNVDAEYQESLDKAAAMLAASVDGAAR